MKKRHAVIQRLCKGWVAVSRQRSGIFDIEIISVREISGGIEAFARAWNANGQIGFGRDGTVDIERFRIFNPPTLVPDGTKDEKGKPNYKEDAHLALLESISQTIRVKKERFGPDRIVAGKVGNTTSTFYPDADPESTSVDGWVRQDYGGGSASWSTIRNKVDGTSNNTTANDDYFMEIQAAVSINTWRKITRGFFLFDTSGIPDADVISAATLSLRGNAKYDASGLAPNVNIYGSSPASNTNLVNDDFDQTQDTAFSTAITYAGWSTSGYNDFALNASGLAAISKTGVSKFAAKNQTYDALNTSPTWSSSIDTGISCFFAESSGTTNDPKLVVEHAQPVTEVAITKSLKYAVTVEQAAITKSLKYAVTIEQPAITKSLRYAVSTEQPAITKSLSYVVADQVTITKSLKYTILNSPVAPITKALAYRISVEQPAITKSLRYAVAFEAPITKSLQYAIERTPAAITKSLRYVVSPDAIEDLPRKKIVLAKVFAPTSDGQTGGYLGVLSYSSISDFTKVLNGGLGECVITIDGPFDTTSKLIQEGNDIEVVVYDPEVVDEPAKRVYAGYISLVERNLGVTERVTIRCLGHYTKLAMDVYREENVTTVVKSSDSLGQVFADIIAAYRANNLPSSDETGAGVSSLPPPKIYATVGRDVDPSAGPTIDYTFEQKTYREAIDAVKALASGGENWYVDADGRISFKTPATSPRHTFIFGRHFTDIRIIKSLEKVRNELLFWNGDTLFKKYKDPVSVGRYGPRMEKMIDYGVTTEAAADEIAARFLTDSKNPLLQLECVVFDSNSYPNRLGVSDDETRKGYDIETIEPGDTCRFSGFDETAGELLRDNMLVTSVRYSFDRVTLTIDVLRSGLIDWQRKTADEVRKITAKGAPTSYN